MNPLVKKEIRLLLPTAAACCTLALPNLFFWFDDNGSVLNLCWITVSFLFCGAVTVMLALNSFGAEISSGTFSNLLAQPISRQKIWDTKILVLAISLLAVAIFWSACGIIRLAMLGRDLGLLDLLTAVGTFGLVIFSGGLWTVLLLRQIAAAFWFTLLVPGVLLVILIGLLAGHSDEFNEGMIAAILGIYSLAGFFFARWLFFRTQDCQWTGGSLVLPEMRGLARFKSFLGARRPLSPRAALWRKEIQLHQSQFVIAFALLVLHLGAIVTRKLGHFRPNSTTEFILECFWMLWLVMPVLVGCAAVAEERRLGTHESQLCLPVKRRTQFRIKLSVAFVISIVLGTVAPWLLEGNKILPDFHFEKMVNGIFLADSYNRGLDYGYFSTATGGLIWLTALNTLASLSPILPFLSMAVICAGIAAIAFYTSTLARNTLQTLAPAVAGIVLAIFLMSVATIPRPFEDSFGFLWFGPLPYFVALPIMALTLLVLAYKNFQHVLTGWKLGWRNLLTFVSMFALSVALTSAIYHRAWEKLTPFEPPHGAARLTLAESAKLTTDGNGVSVRLPGGRTWTANVQFDPKTTPLQFLLGNFKMTLNDARFIGGSNWLTVRRGVGDLVGIKADGTLWVSGKPQRAVLRQGRWQINEDEIRHLVQFGTETNWNSLVSWGGYFVFLTKNDGTLWRWGASDFGYNRRTNRWPGLRTFTPERVGAESNWAGVFHSGYQLYFRKTDGSLWSEIYSWQTNNQTYLEVAPGYMVHQIFAGQSHGQIRGTAVIYHGLEYRVGVRDDGTFRVYSHQLVTTNSLHYGPSPEWFATDLQIGTESNWLAVAGNGEQIVTLKNDGTLWLWNFHQNYYNWVRDGNRYDQEVVKTVPTRLGTQADWLAISSTGRPITTLAADGSLWLWPLGNRYNWIGNGDYFGFGVGTSDMLLDISRKPQLLGNIFDREDRN